jgi:hypothetical protein
MKKTWLQKIEDKKTLPKVLILEKRFPSKIPYWRMLKTDGFLNEKYPAGSDPIRHFPLFFKYFRNSLSVESNNHVSLARLVRYASSVFRNW